MYTPASFRLAVKLCVSTLLLPVSVATVVELICAIHTILKLASRVSAAWIRQEIELSSPPVTMPLAVEVSIVASKATDKKQHVDILCNNG